MPAISDKANKTLRLLTESVGGVKRIRLVTPLDRIHRGAIFEVIGEGGTYRTGVYIDREGDLVRECSCTNGSVHVRRPTCSHMAAVLIVLDALGVPRK